MSRKRRIAAIAKDIESSTTGDNVGHIVIALDRDPDDDGCYTINFSFYAEATHTAEIKRLGDDLLDSARGLQRISLKKGSLQ